MAQRNILLIEDEPLIQSSLKKLLEKRGARVRIESSGSAAIQTILNFDFDKIICDLMLQDVSGFDVIEESKQRYSIDQIKDKFIIITAYSSEQVLERASSYGCQVLSKPFEDIHKALDLFLN